jgi:hypothetical protein
MGEIKVEDTQVKIESANSIAELKKTVDDYADYLYNKGQKTLANDILKMVDIPINKFSKNANEEILDKTKKNIIRRISENEYYVCAVDIVNTILDSFQRAEEMLFHKTAHGKCSESVRNVSDNAVTIENEYDLQHILYPFIYAVFPLARTEQYQDTGHSAIRKDIIIPEHDIVIEIKCTRKSMNESGLGDEIAADIIHYDNKYLFFYIYDRAGIIENPKAFANSYETQAINDKKIYIKIIKNIEI